MDTWDPSEQDIRDWQSGVLSDHQFYSLRKQDNDSSTEADSEDNSGRAPYYNSVESNVQAAPEKNESRLQYPQKTESDFNHSFHAPALLRYLLIGGASFALGAYIISRCSHG